ncbi:hypothetical protein ABH931_006836, partial [Streptacidiphilus sp. MAP12-33]|uniref:hypothetical protein n=1 Tax=Streptacidiphilus sp. MAP12-33 TaxID=3156266 RepID=UPI0035165024
MGNTPRRDWRRLAVSGLATLSLATGAAMAAATSPAAASPAAGHGSAVANPYSPAYGHSYRHGAIPTVAQNAKMSEWAA